MTHGDHGIDLGTSKQRAILTVLAMEAGQPVRADSLVDRVWGTTPPRHVRSSLHAYISRLRGGVARAGCSTEVLPHRSGTYVLAIEPHLVDLHWARTRAAAARAALAAHDDERAVSLLRQALEVWGSQPLAGVDGEWAAWTRSALVRERIGVLVQCADIELRLGRHFELLSELPQLAVEYPTDEELIARVMLTLYKCGFRDDALRAYRRIRERLIDELGVEPGEELQRLHQRILGGRSPATAQRSHLGATDAPHEGLPLQLPHQGADFCGRKRELGDLAQAFTADGKGIPPIVAISGAGGTGKSALAIQFAHRIAGRYPDGQLYVNFQSAFPGTVTASPHEVVTTFLRALGLPDSFIPEDFGEATACYRSMLARRRILVLFDNVSVAFQVAALIPAGKNCAALITSRHSLALLGVSAQLELKPLKLEEAIALLSRIVGQQRIAGDRDAAAKIAEHCGFLPLALRIAGSRLQEHPAWPLAALARRLENESARLNELEFGGLSVRDSLAASYERLYATAGGRLAARLFRVFGRFDRMTVDAARIADAAGTTVQAAEQGLDRLLGERLIETCGADRYGISGLAGLYARELLQLDLEFAHTSSLSGGGQVVGC